MVFEALTGKTLMQHQQGAWQVAVRDWVAARSSARGADSCRVRVSRHLQRVPRDWQAMILACCMAVLAARPTLDADDGMAWVLERRGGQPRL